MLVSKASKLLVLNVDVGDIFGVLLVKKLRVKKLKDGHYGHLCECLNCGNICYVRSYDLMRGHNLSCGCLNPGVSNIHHFTNTRFYRIWQNMKIRCYDVNITQYKNYGGRGIKVCDRWHDFNNFKEDMYESYLDHVEKCGEKDTTLDRIDVNGNYEPCNCRWATVDEQANNTRIVKYLTSSSGERHTLTEWAKILGVKRDTLKARLYRHKWDDDKILNAPIHGGQKYDKEQKCN